MFIYGYIQIYDTMKIKILVTIDDKLLKEVDRKVLNLGLSANRSEFISEALKKELGKK